MCVCVCVCVCVSVVYTHRETHTPKDGHATESARLLEREQALCGALLAGGSGRVHDLPLPSEGLQGKRERKRGEGEGATSHRFTLAMEGHMYPPPHMAMGGHMAVRTVLLCDIFSLKHLRRLGGRLGLGLGGLGLGR